MPNTVTIRTKIKDEANKGFGGLAAGLGQLVGGALIPATAAAAALGVELVGAGAAAGAFGAAVAPQLSMVKNVATEQSAYNKAVTEYGKNSTQALAAQKKLKADMAGMPPATRETAKAFATAKDTFEKWSNSLAGSTMPVFTHTLKGLTNIFPMLTPLVKSAAGQFDQLAVRFEKFTQTDRFKQLVSEFSTFASGALKNVLHGIEAISKSLVHGFESQGFKDFLDMGKREGPGIVKMFKDLAQFVGKFVQAAGPMAGLQLKVLEVLASTLNKIPMSVLQALAPALLGAAAAMKIFRTAMITYEAIRGIVLGFQMLTGATLSLDAAMDANPIGAVVVALVAIGVAVKICWDKFLGFRIAVEDTFDGIKLAAAVAGHGIAVALKGVADALLTVVGGAVHAIASIPGIGQPFKKLDGMLQSLKKTTDNTFNGMISTSKKWQQEANDAMKIRSLKLNIEEWQSKLSRAKSNLRSVPASKRAKLLATISDLEAKIRRAKGEIASVHGKTVTLYMRVVKSGPMAGFTNIGGIARRAGGQAAEGGMRNNQVLVGEGGPEVVNLPTGSYVHSNPDSRRIMSGSGGGGRPVLLTVNIGGKTIVSEIFDPLKREIRNRGGITVALGS